MQFPPIAPAYFEYRRLYSANLSWFPQPLSVSTLSISVSNGFELSCSSFLFGFSCSFDVLALPSSTFSDFFVSVILGSSRFRRSNRFCYYIFKRIICILNLLQHNPMLPAISAANGSVPLFISPNGSLPYESAQINITLQ